MDSSIIVALIASATAIASAVLSALISSGITKYRIEQLEKKVEKHNNVIERTQALEDRQELIVERIDYMREELKELKKGNLT